MKENRARIAIILDRSGSMSSVRESTVAGFNEFVRGQNSLGGDVRVKLVQFDDQYEVAFDLPLGEVPELTQDHFVPRGMTALYDAQGKTIVALGEELAALPESERPSKVIVMTLTDGLENASKEYTLDTIAALIKQQTDIYNWDFIFLGANQDAVHTASSMSIPMGSALTYNSNPASVGVLFQAAGSYVLSSRSGGGRPVFSKAMRKAVLEGKQDAIPAADSAQPNATPTARP